MRRFVVTILLAIAAFLVVPQAAAFPRNAASGTAAAAEQTLAVLFEDPHGNRQEMPYFNVQGAYPGMPAEARTVSIRNAGSVPAAYDLRVSVAESGDGFSVADVLVVTVTDSTERVLYRGPLAQVTFNGPRAIAPGATAVHRISVKWPDGGPSDNRYQGLSTVFEIKARARQAD